MLPAIPFIFMGNICAKSSTDKIDSKIHMYSINLKIWESEVSRGFTNLFGKVCFVGTNCL